MMRELLLFVTLVRYHAVSGQGECTDVRGRLISNGQHYVPGPNTCSLCICDNGLAKYCKAVLCSQPQDCRSFRVGNTCCEFICLDDVVKPPESSDANVRVAAGGAAIVVLLTLAFVVYRLRKQKQRRQQRADDQRSLASIGYISGAMAYVGGGCETGLSGWKPGYMPRGEAPPPYDEAVAQSRAEVMSRMSETAFQRYPTAAEAVSRPEDALQCSGHGYINVPRTMTQMPNPSSCFNAPLLQPVPSTEGREASSMPHHLLGHSVTVGFPRSIRLTGSLGAIANHSLLSLLQRSPPPPPPPPEPERPHNVPGFYSRAHTELHRTIPRMSASPGAGPPPPPPPPAAFTRARGLLDARRSFHRPAPAAPPRYTPDTGRSMPRNLNLATNSNFEPRVEQERRSRPTNEDNQQTATEPKSKIVKSVAQEAASLAPQTLPLTVDQPSCVCSYADGADGADAADDYRSECENCKDAGASRRTILGAPSNWDNWFSAIPDSETESEEE